MRGGSRSFFRRRILHHRRSLPPVHRGVNNACACKAIGVESRRCRRGGARRGRFRGLGLAQKLNSRQELASLWVTTWWHQHKIRPAPYRTYLQDV